MLTPKKRAFLAAYPVVMNVTDACKAASISRVTFYAWLDADTDFKIAYADAQKEAAEALEREAVRRATVGVQRLKFHQGELIMIPDPAGAVITEKDSAGNETTKPVMVPYVEHQMSDTLLIFLMKGAMPEKYRERLEDRVNVEVILKGYAAFDPSTDFGSEAGEQSLSTDRERAFDLPLIKASGTGVGTNPLGEDEGLA